MPSPYDQQGARDMYLNTNATRKEIAEKLGLDPKTVYLWIKNGRWDEMKAAARQAPGIIQQQMYNHITAINDHIADREDHLPTFQEVEMLRKLIVSTKHMQQMSVGTYVQAFQELTSFIGPHTKDHEFTKRVTIVADEYLKGLTHNKHFHIAEKVRDTREAIKEMDGEGQVDNNNMVNSPLARNEATFKEEYPQGEVIVNNPNPPVCHPEATRDLTHEPHNTSLSFGEGRGEASFVAQSGNAENKIEHINHLPSTTSSRISTIPLPDSVSLPDREMVKKGLEQHTHQVEQTITRRDYIKYEYLLETKTEDIDEIVDFNGVKANLMTVQYNLKQFEEPEWRRKFRSREEVIASFLSRQRRA